MGLTKENTPQLVLGCPGAGKTTYLLDQVEQELAGGVPPDRLGFVTFTRKARDEAVGRACARFGLTPGDLPYFVTLHALGFRQMGLRSEQVLDDDHFLALSDFLGMTITGKGGATEGQLIQRGLGDKMLFHYNLSRNCLRSPQEHHSQALEPFDWWVFERFCRGLEQFKKSWGLFDYTDMLSHWIDGGQKPALDVLFVDEAQDLSKLQWRAVEKLAEGARRVVVAGDDDQAIFTWAGADVETFLHLPAQVTLLDQSYRCPLMVQEIASRLAEMLYDRRPKRWKPRPELGWVDRPVRVADIDMSQGEWLVLARNAYLLQEAEEAARQAGWLYERNGNPSLSPGLLRAVLAWETLRKGGTISATMAADVYDQMSAGRGYKRGQKTLLQKLGKDAEEDIEEFSLADLTQHYGLQVNSIWHDAFDRVALDHRAYIVSALRNREKPSQPRIKLSTIHQAKGGEADNVVLLTDMSWQSSQTLRNNPDSETRVFYVGATRARETLHIVAPHTRLRFDI